MNKFSKVEFITGTWSLIGIVHLKLSSTLSFDDQSACAYCVHSTWRENG